MTRCLALLLIGASSLWPAELSPEEHFRQRVWPLLDRACVQCHGPEKQKADLRLDSREAALHGGESGPSLVPGKPGESLLFRLIRHADGNRDRMPPKQKLADGEIADVEKWIAAGASWPKIEASSAPITKGERMGDAWSDPRNPIVRIFGGRRLDLWSLKPIKNPSLPATSNGRSARNPIDQFVFAQGKGAEAKAVPEADRRVLARRVFFDLTGLPPKPEEMAEFLNDDAPDAYERLVDRLLASPRYGEHWARMWLDVVRYSDSNGFDWDEFRPQAWRFRDYVVRSFNADKPFDRFIREQLAGDEMVAGEPRDAAEQDALIATGFLRLGPHDNSAGSFGEDGKVRQQLMADLVETTSAAFLGLTMSCCRCHDHKYDPLSQADHYRLQAFFQPVKFRDDLALDLTERQEAIRKANATVDGEVEQLKQEVFKLTKPTREKLREPLIAKLSAEEKAILQWGDDATAEQKKQKKKLEEKVNVPGEKVREALDAETKKQVKAAEAKVTAAEAKRLPFLTGLLMTDREGEVPATRILDGGDLSRPRDEVPPGIISALDPNPARIRAAARKGTTGRRSILADWIVSDDNPLTARVLVNRVWQAYFGTGIVATPNDFGLAGARPSDPELLDWLASDFRDGGWSMKRLHRLIVTSATYRQSSARGAMPGDSIVRHNPRRLTAEMLRDSVLAVSGKLQECAGGPPRWPELPADVRNANPALLDDNKEKTKGWYPSPKEQVDVRSLYLIQKRTVPVPLMATFDQPDNAVSCARRGSSTVAPQALTLLNSDFMAEAAKAFAQRVEREVGAEPAKQVERVFVLALQRAPGADESEACVKFRKLRSLAELCRAVMNVNEFIYVD